MDRLLRATINTWHGLRYAVQSEAAFRQELLADPREAVLEAAGIQVPAGLDLHVWENTADTFHLDGSAHRLKADLESVGAKADVRFLPGKTHMDLYVANGDPDALTKQIAKEMYAVARPGAAAARRP